MRFATRRSPSVAVDVGANRGLYSLELLKRFPRCQVHASLAIAPKCRDPASAISSERPARGARNRPLVYDW